MNDCFIKMKKAPKKRPKGTAGEMPLNRRRHKVRGPDGKFRSISDKRTELQRWNEPGPWGFAYWIKDVQPKILTSKNTYEPFKPTKHQLEMIKKTLAVDDQGNFKHSISLLIEPRRHGKSTFWALACIWLFCSRKNFTIQLLGTTEDHCRRVQFRTLKRIIQHTPKLTQLIPEKYRQTYEIKHPKNGSIIQMPTGMNVATAFGDKINVLWVSDLHACIDLSPFNALQAALLDSEDSLCFIDSNVDFTDGPVHGLQQEAKQDQSIYCHWTHYRNFKEFEEKAPHWINRQKAKRLKRTSLPADYKRDILGQRSDAKNALFPAEVIKICKSKYKIPVSDINELTKGRSYKVGGGLDRAKSLIGGDNTVWTVVLKVASPEHGEPEIYLLNQETFTLNTARSIKKSILKDHERYSLNNVVLENYEVSDLAPFLSDQRIPYELQSAHDTAQNASFPEFFRIAKEGRFHFPESLKDLASEMSTFTYTQRTGGKYSFGHASQKFRDDRVYSVNWAIFALREAILNVYTLGHVQCHNKSPKKHLCFLMGGELELLCKYQCPAYHEVEGMFREFKKIRLDDDMTLPEFFQTKVKLEGARIYQAA